MIVFYYKHKTNKTKKLRQRNCLFVTNMMLLLLLLLLLLLHRDREKQIKTETDINRQINKDKER